MAWYLAQLARWIPIFQFFFAEAYGSKCYEKFELRSSFDLWAICRWCIAHGFNTFYITLHKLVYWRMFNNVGLWVENPWQDNQCPIKFIFALKKSLLDLHRMLYVIVRAYEFTFSCFSLWSNLEIDFFVHSITQCIIYQRFLSW